MEDYDYEKLCTPTPIKTQVIEHRGRQKKISRKMNMVDSGLRCFPTSNMSFDNDTSDYYKPQVIEKVRDYDQDEEYPKKKEQKDKGEPEKVYPDRLYIDNTQKMNLPNKRNLQQVEKILFLNPHIHKAQPQHHCHRHNRLNVFRQQEDYYRPYEPPQDEYDDLSDIKCPKCKMNISPEELDTHESVCRGMFSSYNTHIHARSCSHQDIIEPLMNLSRQIRQPRLPRHNFNAFDIPHINPIRRQEPVLRTQFQMEEIEDRLNQEEQENQRRNQLINEQQIKNMLIIYHKQKVWIDQECSICNEQKQDGMEVILLPCSHSFHPECLTPWLSFRSTCPNCKVSIRS